LKTGAASVADPMAGYPDPVPSGTNHGDVNLTSSATIQPGIYHQLTVNGNITCTMAPGLYYFPTGTNGINLQNSATLQGDGVMIFNGCGDHFNFQQAALVDLSPPTSGTYRGISFWCERTDNNQYHIECSHNVTMSGTIYSAKGFFDLRPDGASTVYN